MRRVCARVAVVDGEGTLLLVRVHDREPPHTGWLVVPGGGLEDGEEPEDAARRELHEEVGLEVDTLSRRGTVDVEFPWLGRLEERRETVFAALLPERPRLGESRPDDGEEWLVAWWRRDDARRSGLRLYPPQLPELVPEWR